MTDISLFSTLINGGVAGITIYLIFSWNKERSSTNSERKAERELWYQSVTNHMLHDTQLHEKHIETLQKLCDIIKGMDKRLGRSKQC